MRYNYTCEETGGQASPMCKKHYLEVQEKEERKNRWLAVDTRRTHTSVVGMEWRWHRAGNEEGGWSKYPYTI